MRSKMTKTTAEVATETLQNESLQIQTQELASQIVQTVLNDPKVLDQASQFLQKLMATEATRGAVVQLTSNVLNDPQTLAHVTKLSKQILFNLFQDPTTLRQFVDLIKAAIVDPTTRANVILLLDQLMKDEPTRARLTALMAWTFVQAPVQRGVATTMTASVHNLMSNPDVQDHAKEFIGGVVRDETVQTQSGEALWKTLISQKRLRQLALRRTLPVPTISFGNVTWGGTGKTPCLHHVARMINSNGHTLLLVSRGYGDDEWKMFAAEFPHSLLAIGKHRYWNAMAQLTSLSRPGRFEVYMRNAVNHQSMESRTPDEATNMNDMADSSHPHVVALLDDGLQQWGLKKDLEIVMVDCYNPFGNGHLIPSGRLRELPQVALPAADIVVLHHASHLEGPALMQLDSIITNLMVSMARPDTIVAHSRMRLTSLPLAKQLHQHLYSRHQLKLTLPSNELVVGLCGIGCPQSFRDTLRQAFPHRDVKIHAFPDHHAYTAADLTPIVDAVRNSGRPVVVVTTEKDYFRAKDLLDDHLPSLRVALCELEFIRGGELIKQRVDRLLKDD
ncbi:hypothetical protein DYB34_007312 [Aphanomyces astaci]|nr:hypothetical protein DYB34_007312 [Aphanomyces astaci]